MSLTEDPPYLEHEWEVSRLINSQTGAVAEVKNAYD